MLNEAFSSNRVFQLSGVMSIHSIPDDHFDILPFRFHFRTQQKESSWKTTEEVKNDIRVDLS
jgi:hypothetical protein